MPLFYLKHAPVPLYRDTFKVTTFPVTGGGFDNANPIAAEIDIDGNRTEWLCSVDYKSPTLIRVNVKYNGARAAATETGQVDIVITNGDANTTQQVLQDIEVIYDMP